MGVMFRTFKARTFCIPAEIIWCHPAPNRRMHLSDLDGHVHRLYSQSMPI